jgi:hypothetical protein
MEEPIMNRFAKLSALLLVATIASSTLGLADSKKPTPPPPKPPEKFWTTIDGGGGPVVGTSIGQPIGGGTSSGDNDGARVKGSCSGKKTRC